MIKAIETIYPYPDGDKFRSRLEARWAVFFNTLGLEYRYEHEGFDLGDGVWYLPDFWLPKLDCWVEIKPVLPSFPEISKCAFLSNIGTVYLVYGQPGRGGYVSGGFDAVGFESGQIRWAGRSAEKMVEGETMFFMIQLLSHSPYLGNSSLIDLSEKAIKAARQARFERQ